MNATEPAGRPSPADPALSTDFPQSRYVVERAAGGGGRAVYEVIDRERKPLHRVVCRTNRQDANMIAAGLKCLENCEAAWAQAFNAGRNAERWP